jgi:glycerol-3-phosphate dehydrogenase (NAD(P)+)
LGKGRKIEEIIKEMSMVAEGVKACGVVMELAKEYNVEMPITEEVYKVINHGNTAFDAYKGLLRQAPGAEAEPG